MAESDYYAILGLRRGATPEDVKRAYRNLAKRYHPDLNSGDPRAAERFRRIARAYGVLGDPSERARYDQRTEPRPSTPPPTRPTAPKSTRRRTATMLGAAAGLAVIVLLVMASPSATPTPNQVAVLPPLQLAIVSPPPLPPVTPPPEIAASAAAPVLAEYPAAPEPAPPPTLTKPALASAALPARRLPPPKPDSQVAEAQAPNLPPPPPYIQRYPLLRRPAVRLYYYYRWLNR